MPEFVYRQRNPQNSPYYQCVEDHFETFEMVYDDRFERRYGFFRPYVKQVIYRYMDCGILHHGFARVRCEDCGHEYLLAFSCKRRHFCLSCHQKRVVEFGEWLCHEVVKAVPHRHAVLSISKILRRYFLYDRKLLSDLSRCGWEALKLYLKKAAKGKKAVPGAVIAIQSLGDFLGFNPHLHVLISDGCFHENGMFSVAPVIDADVLEGIFRHMVLEMLLAKGKITQDMIKLLDKWRHTGFNVFCGQRILPWQKRSMENLARYIIRASFSQERMTYHRESGQVEYQPKDGKKARVFDALEWLAAMCSHVPNKGEQTVRYYGHYSNVSRGRRKKARTDDLIPYILEPELSPKEFRKSWARLIQKIYEVDPLVCSRCQDSMRVIAFIEDEDVIKKILKHLGLWDIKRKPSPRANAPPIDVFPAYDQPPAHPPPAIILPILTTRWKPIFSSRGHGPPGLSGRLVGSKPVERSPKPGEDRFSVSKFWAFQHVYEKFFLDIMSDISHKNCTGRLPIFGCCGGMWSYYILGFSLTRHTTLIFSIFHA